MGLQRRRPRARAAVINAVAARRATVFSFCLSYSWGVKRACERHSVSHEAGPPPPSTLRQRVQTNLADEGPHARNRARHLGAGGWASLQPTRLGPGPVAKLWRAPPVDWFGQAVSFGLVSKAFVTKFAGTCLSACNRVASIRAPMLRPQLGKQVAHDNGSAKDAHHDA